MSRQRPDLSKLLDQAQQMQHQFAAAQEELSQKEFEGSAGGGVVKSVVSGSGEVLSVDIDPSVIDPEDPDMLGDLVVASVNGALRSANEAAQSQLGGVTGGLDLGDLLP